MKELDDERGMVREVANARIARSPAGILSKGRAVPICRPHAVTAAAKDSAGIVRSATSRFPPAVVPLGRNRARNGRTCRRHFAAKRHVSCDGGFQTFGRDVNGMSQHGMSQRGCAPLFAPLARHRL